ncbi:GNAT family N-acetyltransferase [Candidatus Uhrbacteria bacterium]|nr:GNAT family N-acetyltransferase [Candidatus Uhrbacteria bacterium]
MDIRINRIDPTQTTVVEQIARVYREAFGGAPWYETWDIETIKKDFSNEMKRRGAVCVVAQIEAEVVGFAWGYTISTPDPALEEHLDAPGIHNALYGNYFYLDECAVTPSQHGRGIGKKIVQAIFAEQKHAQALLRTKDGSPMFHLIARMGGNVIQRISGERVIMWIGTRVSHTSSSHNTADRVYVQGDGYRSRSEVEKSGTIYDPHYGYVTNDFWAMMIDTDM